MRLYPQQSQNCNLRLHRGYLKAFREQLEVMKQCNLRLHFLWYIDHEDFSSFFKSNYSVTEVL